MLILAYDTSTFQGAAGWARIPGDGGEITYGELIAPAKPGHAENLLQRLEESLRQGNLSLDQVDLLVYTKGPGTFTGLRIGLATAKSLAMSLDIPMVGLSSLETMAASAGVLGSVLTLMDARRQEIYAAHYRVTLEDGDTRAHLQGREACVNVSMIEQEFAQALKEEPVYMLGSGVVRYEKELSHLDAEMLKPRFATASPCWMAARGKEIYLSRGGDDLNTSEPVYLREPDAKLPS